MTHSIAPYIKEIGRGKEGARALTRAQASDLFGLILDDEVSDLEVGAFCLAMRIKGETSDELMGFIDATELRINPHALPAFHSSKPIAVIPSYNGARKLPVLTPLLAGLLQREGFSVLIHGIEAGTGATVATGANAGSHRVTSAEIFSLLNLSSDIAFVTISKLSPPLKKLLDVRRVVGLRNSAHSVVKLINPYRHFNAVNSVLVTSYTHPEYAISMNETLNGLKATALLLRGTEGEAVADARRAPMMNGLVKGLAITLQDPQHGSLNTLPLLPNTHDAVTTARYIESVLNGSSPIPMPIALQVKNILKLV